MPNLATLKAIVAADAKRLLAAALALALDSDDRSVESLLAGDPSRWQESLRGGGAARSAARHARSAWAMATQGDADALDEIEAAADELRAALESVDHLRAAVG